MDYKSFYLDVQCMKSGEALAAPATLLPTALSSYTRSPELGYLNYAVTTI